LIWRRSYPRITQIKRISRKEIHRKGAKDAKMKRKGERSEEFFHRFHRFEGFPEKSSESF
jgi:hypothetical protein